MSCLAFSEEHCWHSSVLSQQALFGIKIQCELSTTLKLSLRPSFTPIQFNYIHVYIGNKLQPRLDLKRNRRRLETKPTSTRNETGGDSKRNRRQRVASKSLPNITYCLFADRQTIFARQNCFYNNHASAYCFIQTVYCRFIY